MDDKEAQILQYYVGGKKLDDGHSKRIINKLKSIGLLRCGVSISSEKETAKTTELGKDMLRSKCVSF